MLSDLIVIQHKSSVGGPGPEIDNVPDDEDETHENDQNEGAGDDDAYCDGHGLFGGLEEDF